MGKSYYPQSEYQRATTMTVGDLIERLKAFDPSELVIFQSPFSGSYGPKQAYTIDAVERVALERKEHHTPAHVEIDEETGQEFNVEADTQVFNAWSGVVIR